MQHHVTYAEGAVVGSHATEDEELVEIAVLNDGVDHKRDEVVLHTHSGQGVDVGMVQATQQRGLFQELGHLVTMPVLLLKAWGREGGRLEVIRR